ncbi:glucan endo-1,3-beta-glucosidase-like [Magnolia sinica]|uniref:glucan endo-1,3-beta-glucosidase-like n=1 Tax=Magnolia sinica TaxID=86752 RepID=UPI0026595405|nr:glucan endo-1,3-beta-glucosidase-like [Magnolia sinica]
MARSSRLCVFLHGIIAKVQLLPGGSHVGVCYGMLGNNLPEPSNVVALYHKHQISKMRLYDPNPEALQALQNTGIELIVGVHNQDLQSIASSISIAYIWVQQNIQRFWPAVSFRYIAVGNEVIPGHLAQFALPAVKNIHNVLKSIGLDGQIKVSTSVSTSIMGTSYPPSAGTFSDSSCAYMGPIAQFLAITGGPLLANVHPYFSYVSDPWDIKLDYAIFQSKTFIVLDGPYYYMNLFDAIVDALYAALEKADAPQVPIVVSESGWPSDGGSAANISIAETYVNGLIDHVASNQGTPRRWAWPIEAYVFAMFNENLKPAGVEQHWGLFYPDEQPVLHVPTF